MGNALTTSDTSTGAAALDHAQSLRNRGKELAALAQAEYQLSQQCWRSGDGAGAAEHKQQRLSYQKQKAALDKEAADVIFRENNRNRPENEVDLHGLFVAEALDKLDNCLQEAKRKNLSGMIIIVGKGNHSQDRIAKLKPAVAERLIKRYGLRCYMNEPNQGCIRVEFVEGGFIGWVTKSLCVIC